MAVTLKDVALRARVTPPVVSRVLHNRSLSVRVSAATAERVRQAAEELGYRVNVMARNFRAQETKAIGVVNGMGEQRPQFRGGPRYFASLMDGIVESAFRRGYSVTLCPLLLGEGPLEGLGDGRFDGLIWYSIRPGPDVSEVLRGISVPLVIVHGHAEAFGNLYPTVICDDRQGTRLAVEHLVKLGHKKMAFVTESDANNVESLERLEGFRDAVHAHGLAFEESDVLDFRRDNSAMSEYLTAGPRHTALMVHGDGLAGELVRIAPSYGIQIPTDLSIIGFDSTEYCDELRPGLTSVRQPLTEIGAAATEILLQRVSGETTGPLESVLACGFDERGSTAGPREDGSR